MARKYTAKNVELFIDGVRVSLAFEVEQRPVLKAGPIEYLRFQGYTGADESALIQ